MFVSLVQSGVGGAGGGVCFWQGLCACTPGRACERVHMCICLCLLIIHGYFFQAKRYALLCMIYNPTSQAAGLSCETAFGRSSVFGSQGQHGEPAIAFHFCRFLRVFFALRFSPSAKGAEC